MKTTCAVPRFDSCWLPHLAERIGDTLLKLMNGRGKMFTVDKSAVVCHWSMWHIFFFDIVKSRNTATVIFNSVNWRVTDTVRRHHLYSSYCIGQDLNFSIDF